MTETLVSWPVGGNVLFGGREADELLRDYARTKLPEDMAEKNPLKMQRRQVQGLEGKHRVAGTFKK